VKKPINYKPFRRAWKHQDKSEVPFLLELRKRMKKEKPYKGLKILHNVPISLETACKVETLLLSGADVTIADNSLAPATKFKTLHILKEAGISVLSKHKDVVDDYDFCLDCGAEFVDIIKPRKGIVELTRTGALIYSKRNLKIPVLSVDDSKLKSLETFFGTGDGFIRSFLMLTNEDIKNKNFVIFGFGKVGKGVVHFLKPYTKNITVIDIDPKALMSAKKLNLQAINLKEEQKVKKAIKNSFAIASATGVKHVISKSFKLKDKRIFKGKYLANIGIDEFGDMFADDEILYHKKWPINFALPDPTKMRYLDPSFYAHNIGPEIILSRKLQAGYHIFPDDIDNEILKQWQKHHKEDISLSQN